MGPACVPVLSLPYTPPPCTLEEAPPSLQVSWEVNTPQTEISSPEVTAHLSLL